ncbi:MAG: Na(+)-translocating NADH-quinone reductase subunit C [Pseudomonadota bacterium]
MRASSTLKTLTVVLGVCLVCSFLVSTAAVKLYPIQQENQRLDKIKNILVAGGLFEEGIDIADTYSRRIEPLLIELKSGARIEASKFDAELNIETFDIATWAHHPEFGENIPPASDRAKIKRRSKYMVIYLVKNDDGTQKVILPIYGKGLWSTLYGFLALERDLRTIAGITFYAHGETPGLGGEVDNLSWKNSWKGKQAFDPAGNVAIKVVKGRVDADSSNAMYQVEGLSGATITTRGVHNLVTYWLSEDGYGPFLDHLRGAI